MKKLNHICKYILILALLLTSASFAKAQDNPILYQTFIREDVDADGGQIAILDALTLKQTQKIVISPSQPENMVVTADNKIAFITNHPFIDNKKGILAVNLETEKKVKLLEGISIYGAKLSPDGKLWLLLDETQEIAIVNPKNLEISERLKFNEKVRDIIFTPDDRQAYISLFTKDVFKIDTVSKRTIAVSNKLLTRGVNQPRHQELELSPDGKLLFVGSKNTVSVLDTENLNIIDSFTVSKIGIGDLLLKITSDGKFLYVIGYLGTFLFKYDITNKKLSEPFAPPGGLGPIFNINISQDGKILYANRNYGVSLLDVESNNFIAHIQTSTGTKSGSPFSRGIALSGNFAIGQPPVLQTTSPAANQQVTAGQATTIKWQTTVAAQSYAIASHMVELSIDGGVTFAVIAGAERLSPTAQEFVWQVADIEVLNKAQIRVSTIDLGARRANSATGNFSIVKGGGGTGGDTQAPTVTFLTPKGGERFTSGDNLQISWMSSDNVAVTSQDLSLSTDGGNTFATTLASGLPGTTQSFSFPIPMTLQSEQTRLRLIVRDAAGNTAQALTPSNFAIGLAADTTAPVVVISQPTPNQSLIAGQPIQVKWQSSDNRAVVNQALLLSLDAGKTFTSIASFGANDNSFVINNIAQLAMSKAQVLVRITATDSSGNIGQANAQFSLNPAITNATYQSKVLNLVGIGFMSSNSSSTSATKVFINDKEITLAPTTLSNTSFSLKANKKKLGIVRGNNSVRLMVDGIASNTIMFSF